MSGFVTDPDTCMPFDSYAAIVRFRLSSWGGEDGYRDRTWQERAAFDAARNKSRRTDWMVKAMSRAGIS